MADVRVVARALAGILALSVPVAAHDLARSEARLDVQGATIHCELIVDLLEFPGADADGNGSISYAELDRGIGTVFGLLKTHLVVRGADDPSTIVMDRHELVDEHTARLDVTYTFPAPVSLVEVRSTLDQLARRPDHQHFVTISMGGVSERTILDAGHRSQTFEHRWWTRTSLWLTAIGVAIVGLRVVWFVRSRKRM